jgi:hypothetical protein
MHFNLERKSISIFFICWVIIGLLKIYKIKKNNKIKIKKNKEKRLWVMLFFIFIYFILWLY